VTSAGNANEVRRAIFGYKEPTILRWPSGLATKRASSASLVTEPLTPRCRRILLHRRRSHPQQSWRQRCQSAWRRHQLKNANPDIP